MVFGLGIEMETAMGLRESLRTFELRRSDLWSHGFIFIAFTEVGEI